MAVSAIRIRTMRCGTYRHADSRHATGWDILPKQNACLPSVLNIGKWFNAEIYDIQTGSHNTVIGYLVSAWEDLKLNHDKPWWTKTQICSHSSSRFVATEHGTLALMAQFRAFGHSIRGITRPHLWQYDMIGDAGNLTDGLVYNPNLKPSRREHYLRNDGRPMDVTSHSPIGDAGSATALAAASRALKSYNDSLPNVWLQAEVME